MLVNSCIKASGADEAWLLWLELIKCEMKQNVTLDKSRCGNVCFEAINATTIILNPTYNMVKNNIRGMSMKYAIGELLWYFSKNPSAKSISKFSPFWEKLKNEDGEVNSNYGEKIFSHYGFNQLELAKNVLLSDKNSRQAIIHIKQPMNESLLSFSKDVPCTLTLQFLIREDKLHLIVNMRSNDFWLGFPYDVFCFTSFQIMLAMMLDVEVGYYCHNTASLHLYEKHAKILEERGAL